jgi:hypothetical protein
MIVEKQDPGLGNPANAAIKALHILLNPAQQKSKLNKPVGVLVVIVQQGKNI